MSSRTNSIIRAKKAFQDSGGTLHMSEALRKGLSRAALYSLLDSGVIERITRGVYRLTELQPLGNPDLVTVAARVPKAVVCLISALAFHDLTSQVPHEVQVALPRGWKTPTIDFPPVMFFSFSKEAYSSGIEEHDLDGVLVRIYSAEKTVADCFKYRNKVGMEVAIEALRFWRERKKGTVEKLFGQARICRVENILRPYLEALL